MQPRVGPGPLRINYRDELNPQQFAAVSAPDGPTLVLAGAGAGKTRTLTYRVAWLLEHGIPADRILLLTFTNKSAREMMQRVADLLPGELGPLWGGTFHSIGLRILRLHADRLGYQPGFTVADREDSKDLLTTCIADAGIDVKATRFPKAEVLGDWFSMALNTGRTLHQELEKHGESFLPLFDDIDRIRKAYNERKRRAGLMDFDDLLTLWLRLLRDHPDISEVYQRRFRHVLVDEYQDTNYLQAELLDTLAKRHGCLMAVGDDAQSIYSWRGANFANIFNFPERYAGAQVFKVETNYRSTPEILRLANAVIAANTRQFPKQLCPARPTGSLPALVVCGDANEQAAFVAQRALELREEGVPLQEMCVLYRSHFHALELQLELTRRNVPFQITSGIRFFEQAHIKDITAYLKLVTNPTDELAFKRLVRLLPGIGGKGSEKIWALFVANLAESRPEWVVPPAVSSDTSGSDNDGVLDEPTLSITTTTPPRSVAALLAGLAMTIPKKAAASWAQFTATIAQVQVPEMQNAPGQFLRQVLEADYGDYLKANFDNARKRLEEIEQLAAYADQFTSSTEFLSQLALQTNLEAEQENRQQQQPDDDDRLRLSTVHQAKGLEYTVVFVIMLSDGLFPSSRSAETIEGEEEERRLFYVAVTRAKNELYLCRPLLRFLPGGGRDAFQTPSRFLADFAPELVEEWNLHPTQRTSPPAGVRPGNSAGIVDAKSRAALTQDESVQPDSPTDGEPF